MEGSEGEGRTIEQVPNKLTITVLGSRYSGKTTLLNSLIFPKIIQNNNYTRTYGYDIRFLSINDNILIKFFDIGDVELDSNESVFQEMSWYSHYIIYVIDSKIKESLSYISSFEDVFKKNNLVLIFTKLDQVKNDKNFYLNNSDVKKFIKDFNINNIFYVNSLDENSIKDLKQGLFDLIQNDLNKKIFTNIRPDDFDKNPILFHRAVVDKSRRIGC